MTDLNHSSYPDLSEDEELQELFPPVNLDFNYGAVLIFDGLPVTEAAKATRLESILMGVISQKGAIKVKELFMPQAMQLDPVTKTEKMMTKGYAFVEFVNASDARKRSEELQGFALTKKDIFQITPFEEFEALQKIPPTFTPTPVKEYKAPENLCGWLLQQNSLDGMDQFVTRFGEETQILWHGQPPEVDPASLNKWRGTENVDWSPSGSYLVVYLKLGIQLWGGPNWTKQKTFKHEGVMMVQFSPCERYLVTFSPELAARDKPSQDKSSQDMPQGILIWDIQSQKCIRGFHHNTENPAFKWSHDGSYFSKLDKGLIYIYTTPSMTLVADESGKKVPLKLQGQAHDHEWSPTDNYLCVYVPEFENIPSRVMLLDYPSLRNIGTQALVNVDGCHIHWHAQGDYLGVKVDRHAKNKKQSFTSFEFFRVREKNVPIEGLELKDTVVAFAWEPKGHGFAIIHSEASGARSNVSIYSMKNNKLALQKTLEKKQATHLYWSPEGRHLLLAGLRHMNGTLEFFDTQTLLTLQTETHPSCTDICWDPTGRYVASYASYWKNKMENGYKLWSFLGKELLTVNKDPFYQFIWRPRPKSLLSKEQLADLQKPSVFKKFQQKYKVMDHEKRLARKKEIEAKMEKRKAQYKEEQRARLELWKADASWRASIGSPDDREEDFLVVEECVEEVLETKVEELEEQ